VLIVEEQILIVLKLNVIELRVSNISQECPLVSETVSIYLYPGNIARTEIITIRKSYYSLV